MTPVGVSGVDVGVAVMPIGGDTLSVGVEVAVGVGVSVDTGGSSVCTGVAVSVGVGVDVSGTGVGGTDFFWMRRPMLIEP